MRRRGVHKGYGVWRPAGTRVKLPSRDVDVEGEIQTTCPGLMLHRAVDRYGKGLPHWNITHTASGMKIVTAGTKNLARKASKILCRAKKECGITWDVDSDEIVGNSCMRELAHEANMLGQRGYSGTKKKMVWKHTGGGCAVGSAAEGSRYPCDDTYEHIETGEEVWVDTTSKAHAKMPRSSRSMEHIWRRAGVKKRG